jgi:hypothetical protein
MRTQSILLALLLSCSALAWACGDAMPPPPATPATPTAPVTTVVLDAGAPVTAPAPMAVAVAPVTSAAPTVAADPADAGATTTPAAGDFFSCTTVADCVAVAKNDCCKNGFKEAVNANSVDAYRASAPACNPKRKCPMFRIMDKRVPACTAGKCTLVQPDGGTP